MSEMIERVARALSRAGCPGLDHQHRALARAAIEAMREPTEAMVRWGAGVAVEPIPENYSQDIGEEAARQAYTTMIDVALTEPPRAPLSQPPQGGE